MTQVAKRRVGRPKAVMTEKEKTFVRAYAVTGDRSYAEMEAGMSAGEGTSILGRPEVKAKILEIGKTRVATEGVPNALRTLMEIMNEESEKAFTARVAAAKLILDYAYAPAMQQAEKKLEQMSFADIEDKIAELQNAIDVRESDLGPGEEDIVGIADMEIDMSEDIRDVLEEDGGL